MSKLMNRSVRKVAASRPAIVLRVPDATLHNLKMLSKSRETLIGRNEITIIYRRYSEPIRMERSTFSARGSGSVSRRLNVSE